MKATIAYLIAGELFDKKGLVNTVLTKVHYLNKSTEFNMDVYFIQTYWGMMARMLKPDAPPKLEKKKKVIIDGTSINVIWKRFSFIDYILTVKLGKAPIFERFFVRRVAKRIKGYSLSSSHSLLCAEIALYAKKKYNVPYVCSWYGSDIHTFPYRNNYYKKWTIKVMDNASHNFMCSKDLWENSLNLTTLSKRSLLYNGVRPNARRYSDIKRQAVRNTYNNEGKKIVAFAGGFIEVKNPVILPDIFQSVDNRLPDVVEFWVIGNGKLLPEVEKRLNEYGLRYRSWGYVTDDVMLDLLNCIDVIVLPSLNEGLPLITIEGLACGANVVGSRVGGIPEAIGLENTFELDSSFVDKISERITEMVSSHIQQELSACFLWDNISRIEKEKYLELLNLKG